MTRSGFAALVRSGLAGSRRAATAQIKNIIRTLSPTDEVIVAVKAERDPDGYSDTADGWNSDEPF